MLGCDNESSAVYNVVSNLKDENKKLSHTVDDLMNVLSVRENRLSKIRSNIVKFHVHLLRHSASNEILKGFKAFYRDCFNNADISEELKIECENTKCDKASQVEQEPHGCPKCNGAGETIYKESGFMSTDFHTLISRLSRINDAGQMFVKCSTCKGNGFVWAPN